MYKLTRATQSKKIKISLRKKNSLFTFDLLIGISLAFLIHFAFILSFGITETIEPEVSPHGFIAVEIDRQDTRLIMDIARQDLEIPYKEEIDFPFPNFSHDLTKARKESYLPNYRYSEKIGYSSYLEKLDIPKDQ